MHEGWTQNTTVDVDQWDLTIDAHQVYGHISNYAPSNRYCWQAVRGGTDHRLSGVIDGREAAMAKAEEMLALPIDEFNALVAIEIREDITRLEKVLIGLQPNTPLLPGYHAGFEAGIAEMKRRIAAAIDGEPGTTASAATAARGEAPQSADKVLPAATADGSARNQPPTTGEHGMTLVTSGAGKTLASVQFHETVDRLIPGDH